MQNRPDSDDNFMTSLMSEIFDEGISVILKTHSFDALITHLQESVTPLAIAMLSSELDDSDEEVNADDLDRVVRGMATEIAFDLWNTTPIMENNFQPRKLPRPERNALCPCGSTIKYKQCCGTVPALGLQLPPDEMMARVLAHLPQERIGDIAKLGLPLHTLGEIAMKWLLKERNEDVTILLEPLFTDIKKLDERANLAIHLLHEAYLNLNDKTREQALQAQLKTAPNKSLRSHAWQHEAISLSDSGDNAGARAAYKAAEQLTPNDPALSTLDILLLCAEGKLDQARLRIHLWAQKLSGNPDIDVLSLVNTLHMFVDQKEFADSSPVNDLPDDYPEKRLHLHIELQNIDPPIWRRIEVENYLTFADLHLIIQTVMGWDSEHLYEFEVGDYRIGPAGDDMFDDQPVLPDDDVEIGQVLGRKKFFYYEYDFGDGWRHKITVEKRLPANDDVQAALLLDGERACPPEDCGGVSGYYQILEAKKHPRRAENREYSEWFRDFKPEVFKIASARKQLKSIFE